MRAGWVKCNGSTLSGNSYPRLLNYLKNNNLATTIQNSSLSDATDTARQYHDNNPGKFYLAYGTTYDEYNIILPDFTSRFIEGADTAGMAVDAGLPNITGRIEANMYGISHGGVFLASTGAFTSDTSQQTTSISSGSSTTTRYKFVNFSASDSNSIYGNSTTVQPPAVQMIPLIKY